MYVLALLLPAAIQMCEGVVHSQACQVLEVSYMQSLCPLGVISQTLQIPVQEDMLRGLHVYMQPPMHGILHSGRTHISHQRKVHV